MRLSAESLIVVGCLSVLLSLLLAWCLSASRYLRLAAIRRVFRSEGYLLKAHIDFLMMAGLLFATFLLLKHFALALPQPVLAGLCAGSLLNPLGFLALAFKPDLPQKPTSAFGALMSGSFVLTTLGYGGAAWLIDRAALAAG